MPLVSQVQKWVETRNMCGLVVSSSEVKSLQHLVTSASQVIEEDELEGILRKYSRQRVVCKRLHTLRHLAVRLGDLDQLCHLLTSADQLHMDHLLIDSLQLAPCDKRKDIILLLLNKTDTEYELSANLNSRLHGKTPLHVATECGYHDLLTTLAPKNTSVLTSSGETALHCIIREVSNLKHCPKDESTQVHISNLITCVQVLIDKLNIELDVRDKGGYTAVHLACKIQCWDIVKILIEKQANLDIFIKDTSARDIITTKKPEIQINYPINAQMPIDSITNIFELTLSKKEEQLIAEIENKKINVNLNNGELTLLQATVKHGLIKATATLLKLGADVNERCSDLNTPVMLAVTDCNEAMLHLLLQEKGLNLSLINSTFELKTVLHLAVINSKPDCQCIKLLCKNNTLNVNNTDYRNKSALHYAVERRQKINISYLLRSHANIFILNNDVSPAFSGADLDMLKGYLDDHVTTDGLDNETQIMSINYDFLATPNENLTRNKILSSSQPDENLINIPVSNSPDMQNLLLIAKSNCYKHVLVHPVVRCFLHLKWHRYFWLFYVNFLLLATFTASFSVYIYCLVNQVTLMQVQGSQITINYRVPQIIAAITLLFLIFREIFQICVSVSFWHYISYLVNILEIALIFVSGFLLFAVSYDYHAIHTLSAIGVLLAFSELVVLIGSHPVLTVYYTMLFRVAKDFLYFLLWYSLLVVAFGISFYILFQHCSNEEECSGNLFGTIGTSIFRTTVMLQGEFDANNLKFDSFAITSHVTFLFFFFSMVIVLMNLLNGLAVSDIQIIKNEAEVICMVSQVKLYAKFEKIIFNTINKRFQYIGAYLIQHSVLLSGLLKQNKIQFRLASNDRNMDPDIRNSCNRNCFDCNSSKLCGVNIGCISSKHFKKMFPLCFEFEKILDVLVIVHKERLQFLRNFDAQIEEEKIKSKKEETEENIIVEIFKNQELLFQRQNELEENLNMKLNTLITLIQNKKLA